jgi:hypothetical protein
MKDLDFRGKLAQQVDDRPPIHSHTMDQGGSFKMRRQLVRETK